ncbi:hypothetical protein CTI14_10930 [Methylobacterium radiotolerans]|nr:hypothetical protein CTI14_10930 [Methylobacterium radiotolerans]
MKNTVKMLGLLSLSLVLGACGQNATTPTAGSAKPIPAALRDAGQQSAKWFVELEGDPTSLSGQSVLSQQATFRTQALSRSIRYQEVQSFSTLFNGFSVIATGAEINRISQMPGVLGVYPIHEVQLPPHRARRERQPQPRHVLRHWHDRRGHRSERTRADRQGRQGRRDRLRDRRGPPRLPGPHRGRLRLRR